MRMESLSTGGEQFLLLLCTTKLCRLWAFLVCWKQLGLQCKEFHYSCRHKQRSQENQREAVSSDGGDKRTSSGCCLAFTRFLTYFAPCRRDSNTTRRKNHYLHLSQSHLQSMFQYILRTPRESVIRNFLHWKKQQE